MMPIRRHRPRASLIFNMAPMIDVVFLLIIFFVLVSTFASAERVPMELPDPDASQAKNVKLTDRVIINVQLAEPHTGDVPGVMYNLGAVRADSLGAISDRLAEYVRSVPNIKVVIRADRRIHYGAVREVMEVVAENGIERMNIVAHVGEADQNP